MEELGQEKREQEPAAAAIRPSRQGAVITIAREHGSAGKRIGQIVAEKLDIPCYYKELVAVAAQESGLAQEFISGINSDENAVMRELYLTADPVKRAVAAQEKAIRHIADAGLLRHHRAIGGLCAAGLSGCSPYLYLCPGKLP